MYVCRRLCVYADVCLTECERIPVYALVSVWARFVMDVSFVAAFCISACPVADLGVLLL